MKFDTIEKILEVFGGKASDWKQHSNGGGFVQITATVEASAYVQLGALVCDSALVCGTAQVCGSARVYGSALVCDSALVCGTAQVCGSARVYGSAQVYGTARVCDSAQVYGTALVCGSAQVYGSALVCDSALVCGTLDIFIGFFVSWGVTITAEYIAIGYQRHTHEHWKKEGVSIAKKYNCEAEFKAYWPILKAGMKMVTDAKKKQPKAKKGA